jgi:hypothetical protein
MTLKIEQSASPHESRAEYWTWRVWLEGTEQELNEVESVRYQLHSTFPNPIREVFDRSSKFTLKSAGWGEFTIYAVVTLHDGSKIPIDHWLRLQDEQAARPLRVYMSYNFSDSHLAQRIAKALASLGMQVADPTETLGSSLQSTVAKLIDEADVAVVVMGGLPTRWTEWELNELEKQQIDVFPVVFDDKVGDSFFLSHNLARPLKFSRSEDPERIAQAIASSIGAPSKERDTR